MKVTIPMTVTVTVDSDGGDDAVHCCFCRAATFRSKVAELGWIPSFYADGRNEVFAPVCDECRKTRLSSMRADGEYDLLYM